MTIWQKCCSVFFSTAMLVACTSSNNAVADDFTKLEVIDLVEGTGPAVKHDDLLRMHYTGWLYDESAPYGKGRKFDSSIDREVRFSFRIGNGRVIKGWDQGIIGMKAGGKRQLRIPSNMGYGSTDQGIIPPNSGLIFDVELLQVEE